MLVLLVSGAYSGLVWVICSVLLAPSCGRILKLVNLLMYKSPATENLSCFPDAGARAHFCDLSLSCRFWHVFGEYSMCTRAGSFSSLEESTQATSCSGEVSLAAYSLPGGVLSTADKSYVLSVLSDLLVCLLPATEVSLQCSKRFDRELFL